MCRSKLESLAKTLKHIVQMNIEESPMCSKKERQIKEIQYQPTILLKRLILPNFPCTLSSSKSLKL